MVPMRIVHRDRLLNIRYNMRGASKAYRIANSMEGAKSSGKTVPPIGAGNRTILLSGWQTQVKCKYQAVDFKKISERNLKVDFNELRSKPFHCPL